MIHLFHGFLGKPQDLLFFNEFGETKSYDMMTFDDESFTCSPEDILVGYSMGGRVALKIAHRLGYKLKKVIILSANPHTLNEEEKKARIQLENNIEDKMLTLSVNDFLTYWNGLSLFKDDLPLSDLTEKELRSWASTFTKYRLSHQDDYLRDIKTHPDKVAWIVGVLDQKYLTIAENSGVPFYHIHAGHRLFQHPDKIIELIKKEKLL